MTLRPRLIAVLAAATLLLSACAAPSPAPDSGGAEGAAAAGERIETTLKVIAGSEVKDMQPILDDLAAATGVVLDIEYRGTLDGTKAVVDAGADAPWDLAWFPSARYLALLPGGEAAVAASNPIMRSPVVLGVKAPVADRLGWAESAPPSWQDIVDAVERGELRYGMTNPVASNSGFTTLLQATTALSGTGTVLASEDIAAVSPALAAFAQGQSLTSGSSGWLLDAFTDDPGSADGLFNYESVLRGVEVDGEPLRLLVPSDGVITSDYPLLLLAGADETTQAAYRLAVDWLLSPEVQQRIADDTERRTAATPRERDAMVFELPFPARVDTVNDLLAEWLSGLKKPSNMVFAVDTSGSMAEGDRADRLRDALALLTGERRDATGGFLELQPRERITLLEFADRTKSELVVDIPADAGQRAEALATVGGAVDAFAPQGDTAIYDTLEAAYQRALDGADGAITSIVLFTDGENTVGDDAAAFAAWHERFASEHPEVARIPVHVIVFAEADAEAMAQLAELTGGKSFDARHDDLADVFDEIRGYL